MAELNSRMNKNTGEYELTFRTENIEQYRRIEAACTAEIVGKPATRSTLDCMTERLKIKNYEKSISIYEGCIKAADSLIMAHRETIRELEEKHENECRQIAHYENELKKAVDIMRRIEALYMLKSVQGDIRDFLKEYEHHD